MLSTTRNKRADNKHKKAERVVSYPYADLIDVCYALGLAPSEARSMSPLELGKWFNANRPKQNIAGMTEDQAKLLTDMINENPEEFD